jgi:hypothetical protein
MDVHFQVCEGMSCSPPAAFPEEIQREPLGPDGVRYVLPQRPSHVRNEGLFLQIVALVAVLVLPGSAITFGTWCAVESFRDGDSDTGWAGVGFALFALVFVVCFLGLFVAGWLLRSGDCEIIVEQGQLRTTDRVGFLRLSQSGLLEQVRRLVIEPCDMTRLGQPIAEGQRTELAGLRIELAQSRPLPTRRERLACLLSDQAMEKLADTLSGEPLRLEVNDSSPIRAAMGYPRPWVVALARELQRLCEPYPGDPSTPTEARLVAVEEELQDTPDHCIQREVVEQPVPSPILAAWFSGGVLLHVPPVGLLNKGPGRFLFWFSFPWLGFALIILAACLALCGDQRPSALIAGAAGGLMLLVLPLGVGVTCLLAGIHLARRQAILAVAEGRLLIIQVGPFGGKRVEWGGEEIATIGIGQSGMKVQDVPVIELQVQPINGKRFGILAERDRTELNWLATTLRRELHVSPPGKPAPSTKGSKS